MAGNAGDIVQPGDEEVPAVAVALHHGTHFVLALEGRQRGLHGKLAETAHGVLIQHLHHVHDLPGRANVPQTPARHRHALGKAIDSDDMVRRAGDGRRADALGAVIDDGTVHLVGQDEQFMVQRKVRYALGLLPGEDAAGGVVGIIDDQQPGAGRDHLFQRLPGNVIVLLKGQLHPHRHAPRRQHDRGVGDPAGVEDHDLLSLAGVNEGADRLIDGVFTAGRHQDIVRRADNTPVLPQHPGDALPQRADAPGFRVVSVSLGDSPDTGDPGAVRRVEIRLASRQGDDVLSGGPHGLCLFVDDQRRGRRDRTDGFIE